MHRHLYIILLLTAAALPVPTIGVAAPAAPTALVAGPVIAALERQRAVLTSSRHQVTVGQWLQLAEVDEKLGQMYAWEVEEELGARAPGMGQGASRVAAENTGTADKTAAGTAVPPQPSTLEPQLPDWSVLERRAFEVLRCYDGYVEALSKAGELAQRRMREEGTPRPHLVEKYQRLLKELAPVLAEARANRPAVEAARKVRLRVIGACRRFHAQPDAANARDCTEAFVLGLDRPEGLGQEMLGCLDDPTRRMLRLAGQPVEELSGDDALALARWYNDLVRSAKFDAREHGLLRAWLYQDVARRRGLYVPPELAASVEGQFRGLGWTGSDGAVAAGEVRVRLAQAAGGAPGALSPSQTTAGTVVPPSAESGGWSVHLLVDGGGPSLDVSPGPASQRVSQSAEIPTTQPLSNAAARPRTSADTGWRTCAKCGQPFFAGWGSPRPRNLCDRCSGRDTGDTSGDGGRRSIFDFGQD